jgi:hypothetical protein
MAVVSKKPACARARRWTGDQVARILATHWDSPLNWGKQRVVVPRVNTLLPWEADLLAISHTGYLTEIEVKVSAADWWVDAKKQKWRRYAEPPVGSVFGAGWAKVKYFWYAAPIELAQRWAEFGLPDFAGVYGIEDLGDDKMRIHVVRPATARSGHRRLQADEQLQLARCGCIRIWTSSKAQGA